MKFGIEPTNQTTPPLERKQKKEIRDMTECYKILVIWYPARTCDLA